jgi:hypothetical protein
MPDDLWPNFSPPANRNAPVHLLKQQAAALGSKTDNIVLGVVQSFPAGDVKFGYSLDLYSASLGGYRFRLLQIVYPLEFYPVTMTAFGIDYEAKDPAMFRDQLARVFNDPKTKQAVEAIMAQAVALKE